MPLKDALDSLMDTANKAEENDNNEDNEAKAKEILTHFFVCMNEDKPQERTIPSIGFGTEQTLIAEAYVHLELVSRISEVMSGPFGINYNAKVEILGAGQLSMVRKALGTRVREIVKELVEKYELLEVVDREKFEENMQILRKAGLW